MIVYQKPKIINIHMFIFINPNDNVLHITYDKSL